MIGRLHHKVYVRGSLSLRTPAYLADAALTLIDKSTLSDIPAKSSKHNKWPTENSAVWRIGFSISKFVYSAGQLRCELPDAPQTA